MSLHRIYHPPTAFSDDDKQELAERITALYTAVGLPSFYVNIIFISTKANSFFVGGEKQDAYVRIVIQHMASQLLADEFKQTFIEKYEKTISPFTKEKDYGWQIHVEEIANDTWRLNGCQPPPPNSTMEKDWVRFKKIIPHS